MDVLYSADVRGQQLAEALADEAARAARAPQRESSWVYAREIVEGVLAHADEIDEQLTTYSEHWPLARMPAVDRAILRIAVWELLWNPDVPPAVAIAEAVDAAGEFSTEDSARFVNGILARLADSRA